MVFFSLFPFTNYNFFFQKSLERCGKYSCVPASWIAVRSDKSQPTGGSMALQSLRGISFSAHDHLSGWGSAVQILEFRSWDRCVHFNDCADSAEGSVLDVGIMSLDYVAV